MEYKILRFRTVDLVMIALFSSLAFIIGFLAQITKAIPGGGELLLNAFFFPMLIVIAVFLIRKVGTVTIMSLVFVTLTLPTPLLTLPGVSRYPLILIPAIITEIVFITLSRHEKIVSFTSGALSNVVVNIIFLWLFILLGLPGVDAVMATFAFFTTYSLLAGGMGGLAGRMVYERIKEKAFFKKMHT